MHESLLTEAPVPAPARAAEVSTFGGLLLLACAACLGLAVAQRTGKFTPRAVAYASAATLLSGVVIAAGRRWPTRWITPRTVLAASVGIVFIALIHPIATPVEMFPFQTVATVAAIVLGAVVAARNHLIALAIVLSFAALIDYRAVASTRPVIDVFEFQQGACNALLHGIDPYSLRFHTLYTDRVSNEFYAPGMVRNGYLQYGYLYPPLALFMALPGYLIHNDVRYADLVAALLAALLIGTARRGYLGYTAAIVILFIQSMPYLICMGWTEPYSLLCFAATIWCACRWRAGLPLALGLFLASKQYSVLLLPLAFLLFQPGQWRRYFRTVFYAVAVAVIITAPLALWNPVEFWRCVVEFQFLQPFRHDSISITAYFVNVRGWALPPNWLPLVALVPALALGLQRGARSPAGFAASATFVMLVFIVFSKQAFVNYYYLAAGMACCAVAAIEFNPAPSSTIVAPAEIQKAPA